MSFDWKDYLDLSLKLSQSPEFLTSLPEATQRTIISRTYYSAFKVVHNYLRDFQQITIPTDENVHGFVIREMLKNKNYFSQQIGSNLFRLRFLRNLADYQDNLFDRVGRVKTALGLAQEIFSDLSNLNT